MLAPFKVWDTTCQQGQSIFSRMQCVGTVVLKVMMVPLSTLLSTVDRTICLQCIILILVYSGVDFCCRRHDAIDVVSYLSS